MPLNLDIASPVGVLPQTTFTSFQRSESFPMLTQTYHDGTVERYVITDGVNAPRPIHTWNLSVSLRSYSDLTRPGALDMATFRDFYNVHFGPLIPFYFYDPYYQSDGTPVGSNYDASGDNEVGRFVVKFSNATWSEVTPLGLSSVSFSLLEVA